MDAPVSQTGTARTGVAAQTSKGIPSFVFFGLIIVAVTAAGIAGISFDPSATATATWPSTSRSGRYARPGPPGRYGQYHHPHRLRNPSEDAIALVWRANALALKRRFVYAQC